MKIIIEVVGSVMRVEIDNEEIDFRAKAGEEAQAKTGGVSSDPVSRATETSRQKGSIVEIADGRKHGGEEGPAAATHHASNSLEMAKTGAVTGWVDPPSTQTGSSDLRDVILPLTSGQTSVAAGETAINSKPYVLRPHCQRPGADDCGGIGTQHCHACTQAIVSADETRKKIREAFNGEAA